MTTELKNAIVRAAVAWERAAHEKVTSWSNRDLGEYESALFAAVQAYTSRLLSEDAGVPVGTPPAAGEV